MRSGVFISHGSDRKDAAEAVVAALEATGVPCWIAPRDIDAADDYEVALIDAVDAASALVLMLSAGANTSPYVRRELTRAVGRDIAIVPVRLEAVEPSKNIEWAVSTSQYLEAVDLPVDDWVDRLVATVQRVLMDRLPEPPPRERTLRTSPSTLPPLAGSTRGRDALCTLVHDLVLDGRDRLVTLTGLDGIGKSRVAIEVAHRLAGEQMDVRYVDAAISAERAAALAEVAGSGGLLVIDEVDPAASWLPDLAELLSRHGGPTVLVTCPAPLGFSGERVIAVPGLEVPQRGLEPAALLGNAAIGLLLDSIERAPGGPSGRFDVAGREDQLAELCRLVDGMPQALVQSAERVAVLGLTHVLAALPDSLEVLSASGPQDRSRGLVTGIERSIALLNPDARSSLEQLSIFAGGFNLATALAVWTDTGAVRGLERCVSLGLVTASEIDGGVMQYRLPHPVNLVARAHLEASGQAETALSRLAEHLKVMVSEWAERLDSPDGPGALAAFRLSMADVYATVAQSMAAGRVSQAADLTLSATPLWIACGELSKTQALVGRLLAAVGDDETRTSRLVLAQGRLAYNLASFVDAEMNLRRALELGLERGDRQVVAIARCYLGATLLMTGRGEEGGVLARAASTDADELGLYPLAAEVLSVLAISHAINGQWDDERALYESRLLVARRHGDVARTADTFNTLAEIAMDEDDFAKAMSFADNSLTLSRGKLPLEARDATITMSRAQLGLGLRTSAATTLRNALELSEQLGQSLAIAQCFRVGGWLATAEGRPDVAVRLFAAGEAVSPSPSGNGEPMESDLRGALDQARQALGTQAEVEWTRGSAMPLTTMSLELRDTIERSRVG